MSNPISSPDNGPKKEYIGVADFPQIVAKADPAEITDMFFLSQLRFILSIYSNDKEVPAKNFFADVQSLRMPEDNIPLLKRHIKILWGAAAASAVFGGTFMAVAYESPAKDNFINAQNKVFGALFLLLAAAGGLFNLRSTRKINGMKIEQNKTRAKLEVLRKASRIRVSEQADIRDIIQSIDEKLARSPHRTKLPAMFFDPNAPQP